MFKIACVFRHNLKVLNIFNNRLGTSETRLANGIYEFVISHAVVNYPRI